MTVTMSGLLRVLMICGFMAVAGLPAASASAGTLDLSSLVSVTKSERSVTDLKTKLVTTTAVITIKNISTSVIGTPLQAVFDVSSAGVQVLDALAPGSGNSYGKYYADLSSKVASGTLQPSNSVTFSVRLISPGSVRYTYKIITYGTVIKAIPTITWADPAAISFGTALSATQLNAISAVSGNFAYTPVAGTQLSSGIHALNADFTPIDTTNYATASATVNITVNAPIVLNKVPVANAGPHQTILLSGGQRTIDVHLDGSNSSDPDGTVSAYLWTGIPGPVPNSAVSPTVTLYPGTYTYALVVTDDKGAVSQPSSVTITVNQQLGPPQLTVNPLSYRVNQGQTVSFAVSAIHPDGNVVTLSAMPFIQNATFSTTPGASAAGTFTFSPDVTQSGIQIVTFTARDRLGVTDTKTVQITVNKVNHTPVITIAPTATVDEGKVLSITATATDPDGDILTLTATGLPQNALFVPSTGTITFAPGTAQVGQHTVTVSASDGNLSASGVTIITVNPAQTGGSGVPGELVLHVDPVESLSLQATQRITGSVNAPGQPVIPPLKSVLITGMDPVTGEQGQTLTVSLTSASGNFATHFLTGTSQATFGTGITVNSITISSATTATASITVGTEAAVGPRVVTVVTGNETAVSGIGFNVLKGRAAITGWLLDADTGDAISGGSVILAGTVRSTTTAGDGSFLFNDIPSGQQTLTVNASNHELITLPVIAQVGLTINLGDVKSRTTVFNPASTPSATLGSVFGRGGSEFSTKGMTKDSIKKIVVDAILMTGGKSAGVLDEFGNQLNPNITGNGMISLKASGVDMVAERLIRGETMTLGDYLYGFPMLFQWQTQPTLLRALSALQDVVDQAWANPNDPMSALSITLFNRGRSTLPSSPRLSPETPLNAIQAYLMTSTLLAWANNDIYYMNGSDQPSPTLMIGSRERVRTLLASYEGGITTDAGSPILLADGGTPPIASATADRTDIVLIPGTNNDNKEVVVTLDGSHSNAFNGAQITNYQWRPQSSTDPTPPDGNSPTATVTFTSGAHHTYTLTVTDSNLQRSSGNVTINISGDCSFTTRSDQSIYPWCSTFQSFQGGMALIKNIDPVSTKVNNILKTMQPVLLANSSVINAANSAFAAFATSAFIPQLTSPDLKQNYELQSSNFKSLNLAAEFFKMSAEIIQGQLDAFVGVVADKLFSYMIGQLTDQLIETSRPAPPFLRSAKLEQQGSSAVAQQVKLTFMPSSDEKNDLNKSSGGTLKGMRNCFYLIYRQDMQSNEPQRIDIIPGSKLSSTATAHGALSDYEWVDTNPPIGTNVYSVVARVIRTDKVPPSVNTTDQKMLMDFMLGLIPGGGVLNSAFTVVDIADTVLRGLFLQDSDFSDSELVYVGDLTQNLHPSLDLAVDKHGGNAYISIPETSGIFKIVPSGIELFVDTNFKTPYQAGLAVDASGNLYSDNKASDDSYGGRVFSFQSGTGARLLAGSTTYYSQMLQFARPANVATLTYGVDSQGECIYIADAMDQTIKRLALNTANPPAHNVGQIYAQSSDLFFQSTTKMASGFTGKLFLTQGPDLIQVNSTPGTGAMVTKVFPDLSKNPFSWLTGVDFDLAGNLYLADQVLGTITMVPFPYTNFMIQNEAYRKRFTVLSGLSAPQDMKLTADGSGFITVDGVGIHKKNFGIAGRIWDQSASAPLAGATLLVDDALSPGKTDADGFFSLPDIRTPQGPQNVKLKVVASDGRTQLIGNIVLSTYGHTALLEDLVFNPLTMPRLGPIPPNDTGMTVDPDPLPVETDPFQLTNSDLGKTQARHFVVPDRRIFPTNIVNPPPVPPNSSVSDTLNFAPLPLDKPTPPAPSAPSVVQPVVSIVSPANGMITRAGSVMVTGMVESSEAILTATLTINGVDQQVDLANGVFTVAATLKDGINVIFARAGNVSVDAVTNISYFEGRSEAVKVSKGASVSQSLDFSGVVFRADGTTYKPSVDMIVTLYGITDASARYRIIDSVSVRSDGLYQFHLENGSTATAGVKALFQQLGSGVQVPMKVVVSDPRS